MGIISRFKDIMGANVNAMLSKAESENADIILEKYISDAKNNLGQVKAETAAVIAEEMAVSRKLNENNELRKKYEDYARAAVKSGNDDDARKFLTLNQELEAKKEELSKQYEQARDNSEKMKEMTAKLIGDINAAEGKLKELKQKLNIAKQQEKLNQVNEKLGSKEMGSFDNLFDAVQKRIDTADAAASLQSEMDKKNNDVKDLLSKYENNNAGQAAAQSIEEQLAKLKQEL